MRNRFGGLVSLTMALLLPGTLTAQVPGNWPNCRGDSLATWNCASYYSGTVTLASQLKTPDQSQRVEIAVRVNGGRVECTTTDSERGTITGPGMLVVEHETTGNAGRYDIKVWCPEEPGERPTRGSYPVIDIMDKRAADYTSLVGEEEYEHPDADPANDVSGMQKMTWNLVRR